MTDFLNKNTLLLRITFGQLGRMGMATFLGAYVFFSKGHFGSLAQATFAVAVGLLLWALLVITESTLTPMLLKRITANVVPSVILLTEGDRQAFNRVKANMNSSVQTIFGFLGTILLGFSTNILASYVYAWLTTK